MNVENRLPAPGISLLTIVLMVSLSGVLRVTQASQFTPPDLNGFNMHDEREGDGDGDGVNETVIRQYLNDSGDSIVSMTTKGRLWAWSLDSRDNASAVRNYVIRDSNCDGVFDEIYGLNDEFHIPACLK